MSYRITPGQGFGRMGLTRTVATGYDGTDGITTTTNMTNMNVGSPCELVGGPLAPVTARYFIIERISNTSFRLQPNPPNNGGTVSGTMRRSNPTVPPQDDVLIKSRAVTSYPATNQIRSTGALFVSHGIAVGDRVVLTPNNTNEGVHMVTSVIDEDNLTVETNTLSTAAVAGDDMEVHMCNHVLWVAGETTTDGSTARAAAVLEPATGFGTLDTYLEEIVPDVAPLVPAGGGSLTGSAPTSRTVVELLGSIFVTRLYMIRFEDSFGTRVEWSGSKEVWINRFANRWMAGFESRNFNAPADIIQFGTRTGDRYSGSNGCMFFGWSPAYGLRTTTGEDNLIAEVHASAVFGARSGGTHNRFHLPDHSELTNSLVQSPAGLPFIGTGLTPGDLLVESIDFVGSVPPSILSGDGMDMDNVLISETTINNFLFQADGALIQGLLYSDDALSPSIYTTQQSAGVLLRDPRIDPPSLARVINVNLGIDDATLQYTFNPIFVSRDNTTAAGVPVEDLEVNIFEIEEVSLTEIADAGNPYTTDANGQIAAGAGVILRRRFDDGPPTVELSFSHRIRVEGPSHRFINQNITLAGPLLTEWPVDFLQPDFEGEVST